MGTPETAVQIPGQAVAADGKDIVEPVKTLLQHLRLLGSDVDYAKNGAGAVISGSPDSIAVIESTATAAAKWWSAGAGVVAVAAWAAVAVWWPHQDRSLQIAVIAAAAIVSAALVVAIAVILACDVRGRAAASVATIQARRDVATRMVRAAQAICQHPCSQSVDAVRAGATASANGGAASNAGQRTTVVPFFSPLRAKNVTVPGDDEPDWSAIAVEYHSDGSHTYLLVKGSREASVPVGDLVFY